MCAASIRSDDFVLQLPESSAQPIGGWTKLERDNLTTVPGYAGVNTYVLRTRPTGFFVSLFLVSLILFQGTLEKVCFRRFVRVLCITTGHPAVSPIARRRKLHDIFVTRE